MTKSECRMTAEGSFRHSSFASFVIGSSVFLRHRVLRHSRTRSFISRTARPARQDRPGNDTVADIQLVHALDSRHRPHVLVVQAMPACKAMPSSRLAARRRSASPVPIAAAGLSPARTVRCAVRRPRLPTPQPSRSGPDPVQEQTHPDSRLAQLPDRVLDRRSVRDDIQATSVVTSSRRSGTSVA